jgi:hypothetical protein
MKNDRVGEAEGFSPTDRCFTLDELNFEIARSDRKLERERQIGLARMMERDSPCFSRPARSETSPNSGSGASDFMPAQMVAAGRSELFYASGSVSRARLSNECG